MTPVKWLRQSDILARYNWVHEKSAHRAVDSGRLPAPEYPLSPHIPMWREDKLESHEAAQISRNSQLAKARPVPPGFPLMRQALARKRGTAA
jgi:hypothetical protein